jgi:threonine aldolase
MQKHMQRLTSLLTVPRRQLLRHTLSTTVGYGSATATATPTATTIDMRSDTVTQPTPDMLHAMQTAALGDDVFGEDPTVNELEATAATLFGKEAALFVPTGTMGNLLGILSHTNGAFGAEMIVGNQQHTYLYEQGGASSIGGVHSCVLPNQADGTLLLTDIEQSIRSDDPHYPKTTLVSIENTHNMCGGVPLPMDYVDDLGALTKKHNIKLHVDGARIGNAAAALGLPPSRVCLNVDSVSVCLSKGLGSPVGSLLIGDRDFILRARRFRKALGGGMRQAGVLAACGLVSLNVMMHRLIVDHARLNMLTDGLVEVAGSVVQLKDKDKTTTNLGFYTVADGRAGELVDRLREEHNVLLMAKDDHTVRACTHHHIGDEEIEQVVEAVRQVVTTW